MLRKLRRALAVLALSCSAATAALTPNPDQILAGTGTNLPTARFFGQSISTNGQYLAVGAPGSAGLGAPGSVWIYTRNGDTYALLNVVQAPSPVAGDGFGLHVQFLGNQLLVGAPYSTVSGIVQRGALYAYGIVAGQFALSQTISPGATLAQEDWFGFHFAADAGWLAVGAPRAGASNEGQIQLYRYDGNLEAWVYHSALNSTTPQGRRGSRVVLRADRLIASAPEEVLAGVTRGYVYEYQRSGNGAGASFAQIQRFRPAGAAVSAQVFGAGLGLSPDGNFLLVGAPFENDPGTQLQQGAVYAFLRQSSGAWIESQRISSPAGGRAQNFGGSISFGASQQALIGDYREANTSSVPVGAVHEYLMGGTRGVGGWGHTRSWLRGAGSSQDLFGTGIAVSGMHVIIGAFGQDAGPTIDAGRAYVYSGVFNDGFE